MSGFPLEVETRLIRWSESSTAGRTITLELPPDQGDGHPFKGLPTGHAHGQRFRMTFIPIADDETEQRDPASPLVPVSGPPQERMSRQHGTPAEVSATRSAIGRERYHNASDVEKALIRAVRLSKSPRFREWIGADNETDAVSLIRAEIGGSRSLITEDHEVYDRFVRLETEYLMETNQMATPR